MTPNPEHYPLAENRGQARTEGAPGSASPISRVNLGHPRPSFPQTIPFSLVIVITEFDWNSRHTGKFGFERVHRCGLRLCSSRGSEFPPANRSSA